MDKGLRKGIDDYCEDTKSRFVREPEDIVVYDSEEELNEAVAKREVDEAGRSSRLNRPIDKRVAGFLPY